MQKYPKGSEWRKWDLQVQTITDDNYKSLNTYYEKLKKTYPIKWEYLCSKVGSEDLVIKYDSKSYFFSDIVDSEKKRAKNYANIFLTFLDIFNSDTGAVCITDHNYEHPYLIDSLLKESVNTKTKIIPGVEINVQGVHLLVLFGDIPYEKKSYSEGIKTFLSKINIDNKKSNSKLTVCDKSYTNVINKINDIGAIFLYPHCNSTKGLFQERGKTDRTHLADQFNYANFNILQSKNYSSVLKTEEYILGNDQLKSDFVSTLGSDARSLTDILQPDNSGNFCWIKADSTFEGLKQIIFEPKFGDRVFIGKEPEVFERIRTNRPKYINSLHISQIEHYSGKNGVWFKDINIGLNSELVAIIGNKGSGKSAVVDILGLLGNTYNAGDKKNNFSFLNKDKFLKKGVGKNFEATLEWKSGSDLPINLNSDIIENEPEKVRYLPQNYFENLTNDLSGEGFKETLENVIFEHLTENYSKSNFKELKQYKSKSIEKDISLIKDEIKTLNSEIINLEQQNHPDYLQEISSRLEEKQKELNEHKKILKEIQIIKNPDEDKDSKKEKTKKFEEIEKLNKNVEELSNQINKETKIKEKLLLEIEELQQISEDLKRLENQTSNYKKDQKTLFEKYDLDIDDIIKIRIKHNLIKDKIIERKDKLKKINDLLTSTEDIEAFYTPPEEDEIKFKSLFYKMEILEEKIEAIKKVLSKKEKQYQEYIETINRWKKRESRIVGNSDTSGSLVFLKEKLDFINNELKDILENKKKKRIKKALEIYKKKTEIINLYKKFKEPVDKKVKENAEFLIDYEINIEASFELDVDFHKKFLNHISQNKRGSFLGIVEGEANLNEIIIDKNLNKKDDIELILIKIFKYLMIDQRKDSKGKDRFIKDQVIDKQSFYDFVFELDFLKPIYELKLGDKQLSELSPGEKGTLLLIFYLMIDKEEIPLIIDQPEDNLDNKSVFIMLTKFIKLAKKQRQIIIVTHNPNLAVGADAEQIIHVHIDKKNKNKFSFVSGAIEDSEINHLIVDILEGTMPAFDKRKLKYYR